MASWVDSPYRPRFAPRWTPPSGHDSFKFKATGKAATAVGAGIAGAGAGIVGSKITEDKQKEETVTGICYDDT